MGVVWVGFVWGLVVMQLSITVRGGWVCFGDSEEALTRVSYVLCVDLCHRRKLADRLLYFDDGARWASVIFSSVVCCVWGGFICWAMHLA